MVTVLQITLLCSAVMVLAVPPATPVELELLQWENYRVTWLVRQKALSLASRVGCWEKASPLVFLWGVLWYW